MLVGFSQQDLISWNQDIHGYQKAKRTKKPFGKDFQPHPHIIKSQDIKSQQRSFDPIQQAYIQSGKQKQMEQRERRQRVDSINRYYKYARRKAPQYDIIKLYGNTEQLRDKIKSIQPVRNTFNPINNQPLPDYFFKNRQIILPHQPSFRNIKPKPRDFNIVTGAYYQDNQIKHQNEISKKNQQIYQKQKKTRNYNIVMGKFYDEERQKAYKQQLSQKQLQQSKGQKYNTRFPPTYIVRQPVILDTTKPLSKSLIDLDIKKQNAKQRYKLKYLIQKEYETRNLQHQQKKQIMLRNRVHNSHSIDNKIKQFSLLDMYDSQSGTTKKSSQLLNPQISYRRKRSDIFPNFGQQIVRQKVKSGGFV